MMMMMSPQAEGSLLDIVGTGGDGAHTINISTAAVVLAAACGCRAAKFGNRSVSSMCGESSVSCGRSRRRRRRSGGGD